MRLAASMPVSRLKKQAKTNFTDYARRNISVNIFAHGFNSRHFHLLFRSSSVVELSAVNRSVVGSNPTCGAKLNNDAKKRVRAGTQQP